MVKACPSSALTTLAQPRLRLRQVWRPVLTTCEDAHAANRGTVDRRAFGAALEYAVRVRLAPDRLQYHARAEGELGALISSRADPARGVLRPGFDLELRRRAALTIRVRAT